MAEPVISNVSDTARWVAVYRAQESARPDALFHDPYADRLAGERGRAIAAHMPRQARNGWPIVVRTKMIDDMVLASVKEGCDCVLNLAAGLDTRPYRLALPASLEWIEADLPGITAEKTKLMEGEKPVCRLSQVAVDLADPAARREFLDRSIQGRSKVLVITEGLLVYLDDEKVRAIGKDLFSRPAIQCWILDTAAPAILAMMHRSMKQTLANAPMNFAPENGVAFFEALGWKVRDIGSYLPTAIRLRRAPWFLRMFARFPDPDPRKLGRARWSAAVRLGR